MSSVWPPINCHVQLRPQSSTSGSPGCYNEAPLRNGQDQIGRYRKTRGPGDDQQPITMEPP